jgi:ppGpp synthetase/RelA/SpoT-type nucleotidyltranferase
MKVIKQNSKNIKEIQYVIDRVENKKSLIAKIQTSGKEIITEITKDNRFVKPL